MHMLQHFYKKKNFFHSNYMGRINTLKVLYASVYS